MFRERLLDRIPLEDFAAAGREVAEKRRDPYSILHDWLGPDFRSAHFCLPEFSRLTSCRRPSPIGLVNYGVWVA